MSETRVPEPPPRSFREVLDDIAEDQRRAGLPPLSDEEAARIADEAVAETRRDLWLRERERSR